LDWAVGVRLLVTALALLSLVCQGRAQGLRYSNRREVAIPDHATLRLGPFYSSMRFSQSAGYRYTRSVGAGTDYLYENKRGEVREDGEEFPLISRLTFRNYLLITRNMDIDLSLWMSYAHYPLGTQEDDFDMDLVEEGLHGNFSTEFALTPYVKGTAYDNALYRTDYVDTRGLIDDYGGERYEYFQNTLGVNMDWLMTKDRNLAISFSRLDVLPRDDEFSEQERYAYNESVAYEHEIFPGLIAGARASYSQAKYEDAERADTRSEDYSLFFRFSRDVDVERGAGFRLTDVTTLTATLGASAGYSYGVSTTEDDEDDEGNDQERLSGSLLLKTQIMRNLAHSFSYRRGLRGGFDSSFDLYDDYAYRLTWGGHATKAQLYSSLSEVQPDGESEDEYSNWTSGASVSYPITRIIRLYMTTSYAIRDNPDAALDDDDEDDESRYDYETWRSRIGTSFAVTRSIGFNTYVEHVERTSDAETLGYERDTFAATFNYSHQF